MTGDRVRKQAVRRRMAREVELAKRIERSELATEQMTRTLDVVRAEGTE